MSGLGGVQLVTRYNGPSQIFVVCTHTAYRHSLIEMLGSNFEEPYKSVQEVYENAFHYRLFAMAW